MEHFGVTPDIMTLAKGISSCYVPLGAVAISASLNQPFADGHAHFIHGFTNGGHPLAVRLASNCWKSSKMSNCSRIAGNKKRFCSPIRNHC